MNLRIGAFGRQEGAAAVWIAAFISGCFAIDNRALFDDGNTFYLTYAVSAVLSLLLFELTVTAIEKRGGRDLSTLVGRSGWKALFVIPLSYALLLAAVRPSEHFLMTVTQYVFPEAEQTGVCMYLLPCFLLLTVLGAETLVRTSRIFLPLLVLSFAAAMLLAVPQFRIYRLYPIPFGSPVKLLSECLQASSGTFSPLLALLCIGEGTQNTKSLRTSGRIGAGFGMIMTVSALLGLGLSFSYLQLRNMPSPFYRLLVEVRTENPTMRMDGAALFLWMASALLSSAFYLFSAGVLIAKTYGVRDIRPVACALSTLSVTLILVLYYDSETTLSVLKQMYRFAWIPTVMPIPFLLTGRRKEKKPCESALRC